MTTVYRIKVQNKPQDKLRRDDFDGVVLDGIDLSDFLEQLELLSPTGAGGIVNAARIHRGRCDFSNEISDTVALKKSSNQTQSVAIQNEIAFLRRIKTSVIQNLNTFYTGFWLGNDYFTISERADQDLRQFWNTEPDKSAAALAVLMGQMKGLVEALNAIHQAIRVIVHYDIKPKNILVFRNPQGGIAYLKFTDWGSCWVSDQPRNNKNKVKRPIPTADPSYVSPQSGQSVKDDKVKQEILPQSDIWSLGCVYLEMLDWLAYGPTGVINFRNSRTAVHHSLVPKFYEGEAKTGFKRPACVNQELERLRNYDLSGMKELVGLVEKMMDIDDSSRPTAADLLSSLSLVTLKSSGYEYCGVS